MMYRHVIEELDTDRLRYDRYVFVGFNVLNKVETRFFQRLQDAAKPCSTGIMTCSTPACPTNSNRPTCTKRANLSCAT